MTFVTAPASERFAPRITVAAIVEQAGRYLMVEEHSGDQIVFNQPAGHLDPGESLLEAAVRETREETGCSIELQHLVSVYYMDAGNPELAKMRFNFAATLLSQNPSATLDEGIIAAHWMSLEDIETCRLQHRGPMVWRCLQDYQQGLQISPDQLQHFTT